MLQQKINFDKPNSILVMTGTRWKPIPQSVGCAERKTPQGNVSPSPFFDSSFKLTAWPFKAFNFCFFGCSFRYPRTFCVPTSLFVLYHLFPPHSPVAIPPSVLLTLPHCLHVAALVTARQAGREKQTTLWPQSWWKNKLKKQWKASTSPKPVVYTKKEDAQNRTYKSNSWHLCFPRSTVTWHYTLKEMFQWEETHKNVCTMLPKQELCKESSLCPAPMQELLIFGKNYHRRVIYMARCRAASTHVYSMHQANCNMGNWWNINVTHWQQGREYPKDSSDAKETEILLVPFPCYIFP